MKHIPILFSTEMVQAILDGRKKMTRRVSKHQYWSHSELVDVNINKITSKIDKNVSCKFGNIGDILWVRESFAASPFDDNVFVYKADAFEHINTPIKHTYKPSIHMPKEACRIFLRVTDVRCERLHEITEQDAVDEGVKLHKKGKHWLNYIDNKGRITQFIYNCHTAYDSFRTLWIMINGLRDEPNSWYANPYVWVVSFERCERPADFLSSPSQTINS